MKYYLIAGEASGDLHGSNLIKAIKKIDVNAEFRCWGGDLIKKETGFVVKHIKDLAFMGFIEVLLNLRTILKNMSFCKADIVKFNPDCMIFIDYPGFNLPIAQFTFKKGFKNIFYISPQVWAWKKGRVKKMKKILHKLLVILPFEKDFFAKQGMSVDFVGHPLLDAINDYRENPLTFYSDEVFVDDTNMNDKQFVALRETQGPTNKEVSLPESQSIACEQHTIMNPSMQYEQCTVSENQKLMHKKQIALLPGSRKQEITSILPIMLGLVEKYPEFEFVVAGLSTHGKAFYESMIGNCGAKLVFDSTYLLLSKAYAALVTSGTATLETALFGVPEIVCYKGNPISYLIAKKLIKDIQYISLVNLVMDDEVVKELIQSQLNNDMLVSEFEKISKEGEYRKQMLQKYILLHNKLGNKGASENAAKEIIHYLSVK